jgi:hypothetical protein
MKRTLVECVFSLVLAAAGISTAGADDKADYNRRAATRLMELFQSLDRNADRMVSRDEVQGDLNFGPRFEDMDVNRDGFVTLAELQQYIEQQHGVRVELGQR